MHLQALFASTGKFRSPLTYLFTKFKAHVNFSAARQCYSDKEISLKSLTEHGWSRKAAKEIGYAATYQLLPCAMLFSQWNMNLLTHRALTHARTHTNVYLLFTLKAIRSWATKLYRSVITSGVEWCGVWTYRRCSGKYAYHLPNYSITRLTHTVYLFIVLGSHKKKGL